MTDPLNPWVMFPHYGDTLDRGSSLSTRGVNQNTTAVAIVPVAGPRGNRYRATRPRVTISSLGERRFVYVIDVATGLAIGGPYTRVEAPKWAG